MRRQLLVGNEGKEGNGAQINAEGTIKKIKIENKIRTGRKLKSLTGSLISR